jgi:hypothetical protein
MQAEASHTLAKPSDVCQSRSDSLALEQDFEEEVGDEEDDERCAEDESHDHDEVSFLH